MPRGWEGNRKSGVTLAMCHGHKWFIHLQAQRLQMGDEHPTYMYAPAGAWLPSPLPLPYLPRLVGLGIELVRFRVCRH